MPSTGPSGADFSTLETNPPPSRFFQQFAFCLKDLPFFLRILCGDTRVFWCSSLFRCMNIDKKPTPIPLAPMAHHPILTALVALIVAIIAIFVLPGCSWNGRPMRFDPQTAGLPKAQSWFIAGKVTNDAPVSCSFVEFDERGDFLDFRQHIDCEARLRSLVESNRLLLL